MLSIELLHIFILGGLILICLNYLLNLRSFRFPQITSITNPPPQISVLIPARNEAERLRPCLSTLCDSDYPILEILVLDDHSTDGTAELSLWPYQESRTWSEHLVIPFVHLFILFYLPHWAKGSLRCFGAANGQFVLFRRQSYDKIKGHESVRNHMVEDIAISRNMRAAGFKVRNLDGTNPGHRNALVECRMYTRFSEVWEGFTKNLYPSFDGNFPAFLLFQSIQIFIFLTPFILIFTPANGPLVWTEILIILALRFALAHRFRQSYLGALLHPFGQILVIAIALNSWLQSLRGRLPWKGRHYPREAQL